jgi:hypothetical protein
VLQARPGTDIPRRIPASCHNKHARRVIYRQERPRSTRERSRPTRKSERNRIGCILRRMSHCVTRLRAATSRTRPLAPARVLSLPPSLHPPPTPGLPVHLESATNLIMIIKAPSRVSQIYATESSRGEPSTRGSRDAFVSSDSSLFVKHRSLTRRYSRVSN